VEQFLQQYGLLALFLGMWVEGETVLIIVGFLAHQHLLNRWEALPVAILGALSVDHALYAAGRLTTRIEFLRKLKEKAMPARVAKLGESFSVFMGVRFVYGTRSPYLFFVGTRGLSWPRFISRELPAVVSWCVVWLFFGHAFGHMMALIYGTLHKHHLPWIILALAVSGLSLAAYVLLKQRQRAKANGLRKSAGEPPQPPSAT
jgi:membrane protein DedA with SNARE-associated domain